ncbi:hypothetical protein [Thiococcus pfennigii]|uniref:hypothetical protein n=1 Tax=Thiococcus pfennigii TaxID=1057 RepID=UPI001906DE49|nr:hypothetical protein [Thiococcus pfennigii]
MIRVSSVADYGKRKRTGAALTDATAVKWKTGKGERPDVEERGMSEQAAQARHDPSSRHCPAAPQRMLAIVHC